MTHISIHPGQVWLDTKGELIQAHGGSLLFENGPYVARTVRMCL